MADSHDTDPPTGCPVAVDGVCQIGALTHTVATLTDRINALTPRLDILEPRLDRIVQVTTVLEARFPWLSATNELTLNEMARTKLTAVEALELARKAGRRTAVKWSMPGLAAAVLAIVLELLRK